MVAQYIGMDLSANHLTLRSVAECMLSCMLMLMTSLLSTMSSITMLYKQYYYSVTQQVTIDLWLTYDYEKLYMLQQSHV